MIPTFDAITSMMVVCSEIRLSWCFSIITISVPLGYNQRRCRMCSLIEASVRLVVKS